MKLRDVSPAGIRVALEKDGKKNREPKKGEMSWIRSSAAGAEERSRARMRGSAPDCRADVTQKSLKGRWSLAATVAVLILAPGGGRPAHVGFTQIVREIKNE